MTYRAVSIPDQLERTLFEIFTIICQGGLLGAGVCHRGGPEMVNFGFRELGLGRISSWCIADNTASARVLERLGFRQEGRLRRNEYFKGAGGIRCSSPCCGRNGRSWPSTGMSEAGRRRGGFSVIPNVCWRNRDAGAGLNPPGPHL